MRSEETEDEADRPRAHLWADDVDRLEADCLADHDTAQDEDATESSDEEELLNFDEQDAAIAGLQEKADQYLQRQDAYAEEGLHLQVQLEGSDDKELPDPEHHVAEEAEREAMREDFQHILAKMKQYFIAHSRTCSRAEALDLAEEQVAKEIGLKDLKAQSTAQHKGKGKKGKIDNQHKGKGKKGKSDDGEGLHLQGGGDDHHKGKGKKGRGKKGKGGKAKYPP